MAHVLNWNGRNVPTELRKLPAGRYKIEPVEDAYEPPPEEEEGLLAARESIRRGRGMTPAQAKARFQQAIKEGAAIHHRRRAR